MSWLFFKGISARGTRRAFKLRSSGLFFGVASALALATGCHRQTAEQKGDLEYKAGRFESALSWYEAAFAEGDRVALHSKMADIFANKLHDSVSAVYHYKRILTLHPAGNRADAAKSALRRLEGNTPVPEAGPTNQKTSNAAKMPPAQQAAAEAEKQAKTKVRTYVVSPGDTLTSISRKFYQTPGRWKDILDANQNQLSNPDELKPGQTIILP